jgi:hypothetical protein
MKTLKAVVWHIRNQGRKWLQQLAAHLADSFGYEFLSKAQTVAYLNPYLNALHPEGYALLPEVRAVDNPNRIVFSETEISTNSSRVWHYTADSKQAAVLRCGLLMTGRKILNTDYWTSDALLDGFTLRKRPLLRTKVLLAPFGHYFDGNFFVGYYDFIFLVAAKLCRMKESVSADDFQQAIVSYPLVGTDYEREFLRLMGFGPDQVVDSRRVRVQSDSCYLGNHDNWTHQNPADVRLLKKHLAPLIQTPRTARTRVYICRAGRRRVLNEEALITLLLSYNFVIIEDKPRSLADQYAIYHNASFIMGPHGASFTNLLWCEPGTHLFELFAGAYAPTHFLYLAQLLGLHYSAYSREEVGPVDYTAIGQDIEVSIPALEQCLDRIFNNV